MANSALQSVTALVIDDDDLMRDLLSVALKETGVANVQSAAGGRQALDMIIEGDSEPNIILCDLQMPEMDGIEVIRHLADAMYRGGLVLVSAEDQRILQTAESFAQVRGLNVLGSVTKPLSVEALSGLLQDFRVSEKTQLQQAVPKVSAEELYSAITGGNLITYYQPQIDVKTGKVSGVETLARWWHPEKGMIPPGVFVDIAERHHLIDALTDSVLAQALDQAVTWLNNGLKFRLAVNISMDNLQRLDFPDRMVAMAQNAGMALSGLVLEVTESRLVKDLGTCLDILTRVRLKGLGLSIDDFGTGYASLEHLKRIPFEELKVDSAFVHGARNDKTARAILETSVALAKQLEMSIVAEGVEDQEDWDLVAELGCDLAQGYFIAPPMSAEAFETWLAQR